MRYDYQKDRPIKTTKVSKLVKALILLQIRKYHSKHLSDLVLRYALLETYKL